MEYALKLERIKQMLLICQEKKIKDVFIFSLFEDQIYINDETATINNPKVIPSLEPPATLKVWTHMGILCKYHSFIDLRIFIGNPV